MKGRKKMREDIFCTTKTHQKTKKQKAPTKGKINYVKKQHCDLNIEKDHTSIKKPYSPNTFQWNNLHGHSANLECLYH